jgi:glucose/arabinose dehydrogenase
VRTVKAFSLLGLALALGACSSSTTTPPSPPPLCPASVDDGNACTVDACNPATGAVTHTPVAVDDGNACTVDACNPATGAITHTPVAVDDGVACTADACNPATGAVTHLPQDAACPSGQTCSATLGCQAPASGCGALQPVAGAAIRLQALVASGLSSPVHAAAPRGDATRVFVVEQPGRVRLVKGGVLQTAPWLDVSAQVAFGGERGLLSVAFHPAFATNGRVYLYFTGNGTGHPDAGAAGDIRIVELTVPDPAADAAGPLASLSLRNLLTVPHPSFANHNGGQLAFGPDGRLYAGTGDGGSGGDPNGNGQNTASLLGKLLRLDVDTPATPVPGNLLGAVYHYGLRNPWRFSFDRLTGDLYIGDVGQSAREEIDFQAAAAPGQPPASGTNWGWNVMEGFLCFSPATGCDQAGKTLPLLDYPRSVGVTVTGGFVYRGPVMPDLGGTYFYADSGTGFVKTLRVAGGQPTAQADVTGALGGPLPGLVSFGEDGCGELLVVGIGGSVSRIVPGP